MELTTPAEQFFEFLLMNFLGCRDHRLIADIWKRYPKSQVLVYQLSRCASPVSTQVEFLDRMRRLSELIDPAILTRTIEKLVVPGKPRPPVVVELEEKILYAMTPDGRWRW